MFRKNPEDLDGIKENPVDNEIEPTIVENGKDSGELSAGDAGNEVEPTIVENGEDSGELSVGDVGNEVEKIVDEQKDGESIVDELQDDIAIVFEKEQDDTEIVFEKKQDDIASVVESDDKSAEEDDPLVGRVISADEDRQEIIIPEGPSKLDGEVLLVRRTEAAEQPGEAGLKVRRVKADRAEDAAAEEPQGFLYSFLDTLRFISLGLLVGILLVVFVIQRNDVYGESMEPTLFDNDAVFVEMISVYLGNFDRGDIVTIDAEGMEGYYHKENLIKRIVGRPGETVDIIDGMIYINGNLLIEPYLTDGVMTYVSTEGTEKGYDHITLGPNEYYCLGDNRGASNDSRRLGPFTTAQIKSHVIARIYPFDEIELF